MQMEPISPTACSWLAPSRMRTSQPGMALVGEPGFTGKACSPTGLAAMAQPVSVCHQWSMTGTPRLSSAQCRGVGVGALASQEQGLKRAHAVGIEQLSVRILALDGPEGRRRREQDLDLVFGNDPPEGARIGGAHRLALIEDGRAAVQQRPVDDVGMADHPAHVGGRPVNVAWVHVVDVLHGPFEGHHVPAVVAHHAFGLAGGAGRIEDIERVRGGDGDAVGGLG